METISDNKGLIYSESSHYILQEELGNTVVLTHFESGDTIKMSKNYLSAYTKCGDTYTKEVKVGKEDRKDGTLGIRSIFEGIHSDQVFTVCFKKQDKIKSKRTLNTEIDAKVEEFVTAIEKARSQKKGVANMAKKYFEEIIANPISKVEEGEDRILRGYKIQFQSRDGRYDCVDMDITRTEKESGIRPVNINSLKWLIFNGVKYIVE